jgi:two-component system sensor histidine kinase AlgZ
VHALQARIRPHFLFNSMNTIAALTRSNPSRAEQAVQDLADLFRASLSDKRDVITLAEELDVARTYQRMEQLRLGERLQVQWNTDALPTSALVPGLMLQPLLENAIYHGIEPRAEGGTVTITGEVSGDLVTLVVRNPLDPAPGLREGNRLALANIRERLSLMYGERALMKSGRFDDEYIVTLRFPLIERATDVRLAQPA